MPLVPPQQSEYVATATQIAGSKLPDQQQQGKYLVSAANQLISRVFRANPYKQEQGISHAWQGTNRPRSGKSQQEQGNAMREG